MEKLDLAGDWRLKDLTSGVAVAGHLPGQNYLDLIAAGELDDPFWGTNEQQASQLGSHDFLYSRDFHYDGSVDEPVQLVIDGLDTLAQVWLNDHLVLQADNAFRTWRADVGGAIQVGLNRLEIHFANPLAYLRQAAEKTKLFAIAFGAKPAYLRKPQCHFGWDWGPNLPPVGITGGIWLETGAVRLASVRLTQDHRPDGIVVVRAQPEVVAVDAELALAAYQVKLTLTDPEGALVATAAIPAQGSTRLEISQPRLWWPNGLGDQPLYGLTAELVRLDEPAEPLDRWRGRIGLRTITLEAPADSDGRNFYFVVNSHRIFAKGADWIPSDTFVCRTTRDDLEYYVSQAARANMNMLRVWGGGYYESDAFYDLCDEYGILVWQDCAFACSEYPLADPEFLANVQAEIADQVTRLRHHASLALWSGNNEVFVFFAFMKKASKERHKHFFCDTLAGWVRAGDPCTPYWPGSPSAGNPDGKHLSYTEGDSHLWQVWHGLRPIEYLGKMPARFCSEFGLESMPSRATVARFCEAIEPTIDDPVMVAHQKSAGGNEKMLYYILSKYHSPRDFGDFIYLSQLIQAEAIRAATEGWRRQSGRCNGAIYWQYNDVWPTASWASIDSERRPKALQYAARHFNAPVACSIQPPRREGDRRRQIHGVNDTRQLFQGNLTVELMTFAGEELYRSETPVELAPASAGQLADIDLTSALGEVPISQVHLTVSLLDEAGQLVSRQTALLVPDRAAQLAPAGLSAELSDQGRTLTLSATSLARFVQVSFDGIDAQLDDNFLDVLPGRPVQLQVTPPPGIGLAELSPALNCRCLNDIPAQSATTTSWARFKLRLKPVNLITSLLFRFT